MTENGTMKDVDHTHPHGDSGTDRAFRRGRAVAADGGERTESPRTSEDERSESSGSERSVGSRAPSALRADSGRRQRTETQRADDDERTADDDSMADVDHQAPGGEGANPAFERGRERRTDVSDDGDEGSE